MLDINRNIRKLVSESVYGDLRERIWERLNRKFPDAFSYSVTVAVFDHVRARHPLFNLQITRGVRDLAREYFEAPRHV